MLTYPVVKKWINCYSHKYVDIKNTSKKKEK